MSQPHPSGLLTNAPRPGGFPYCPTPAWGLGPSPHTTLHRLWTSSERGSREQGKGGAGAGPVLMQSWGGSGQGGCPRGGWSAAASAPAREAGRAQSKLDLVPCSGYRELSARAASLKQLASKNTLGLGSGRHGRHVCFYTPSPHFGIPGTGAWVQI